MNKKEVLEIRKQFTPENCTITRICGCYVDHEKEKKMEMKKAFLSMPEEEAFKYFDIFRHTLSGTVGKNLMTMEFPLDQELEGGAQELLLRLRDTKLTDDLLLEEFYDKVIENYEFAENYYIILIHAAYDVPGKSSDNMEMFDASDTVYEHIMCSICPVKLTKAGLHITPKRTILKTVSVTGSWRCLRPVFSSRLSRIVQVTFITSCTTPRNQKISSLTLLQMYLAILHRLLQRIKRQRSSLLSVIH